MTLPTTHIRKRDILHAPTGDLLNASAHEQFSTGGQSELLSLSTVADVAGD